MTSSSDPAHNWQLIEILRVLPERELNALVRRLRIAVDPKKRIDVPTQVARALVARPEARDPNVLPAATRQLFFRLVEAGGSLTCSQLPREVEPLVGRGMVFARGLEEGGVELILPVAFLLQVDTVEGEDPRSLRALMSRTAPEVALTVASHYLGRPATMPLSLALEQVWSQIVDPERMRTELSSLAPLERDLLAGVEAVGGEVDTAELLELEREPMRLRGAAGATASRRGIGFALERRGLLLPLHPNRHVVPSEVAAIVGEARREQRQAERERIQNEVSRADFTPDRAEFAQDPAPLALAMAMAVREQSTEVREGLGTPKSLLQRFAVRFGQPLERVQFVATLSRAVGLWGAAAENDSSPPGSDSPEELRRRLFESWRRGGVWDEAAPEHELLRSASEVRDSSVVSTLRGLVLDALGELGDAWIPWLLVAEYVQSDSRTPGIRRLLARWAKRFRFEQVDPAEIACRIVMDSLHQLGLIDIGENNLGDAASDDDSALVVGPAIRLTPRGRHYLGVASHARAKKRPSEFVGNHALRIGEDVTVAQVLALAPFVELGGVSGALDVTVTKKSVSRALATGAKAEELSAQLGVVAPVPDPVERTLTQVSTVLARGEFVATAGFLWIEDGDVREMLRTRRRTADLFVNPSPPGGLLLAPAVELDTLVLRCRGVGVEVLSQGQVHHARSRTPAPKRKASSTVKAARAPAARKSSGTRAKSKAAPRSGVVEVAEKKASTPSPRRAASKA